MDYKHRESDCYYTRALAALDYDPPDVPAHGPPVRYRVAGTPPGYGYLVRRHVALRPVAGTSDFREPQRSVDRYLEVWRRRLLELTTIHYDRYWPAQLYVRGRIQRYLDCPPPFCAVAPRGRRCGDDRICPSCRSVQAAEVWSRLDRGLFGDAPPAGARLAGATMLVRTAEHAFPRMSHAENVERDGDPDPAYRELRPVLAYRFSRTHPLREAYPKDCGRRRPGKMASRSTEVVRFRRLGVVAGLDTTRLLVRDLDNMIPHWVVRVAQVLFAPAAAVPGLLASRFVRTAPGLGVAHSSREVPAGRVRVRRVDGPGRRDVAEAVAAALRHESEVLVRGGPSDVSDYLHAVAGRRMFAAFGRPEALRSCVRGAGG